MFCPLGQSEIGTCTEFMPPSPYYLQMVVDYVEMIFLEAAKQSKLVSVIFDMHMRWCPLGIGGTFSCLEGAGFSNAKYPATVPNGLAPRRGAKFTLLHDNGDNLSQCLSAGSDTSGVASRAARVASGRGAKIQKYGPRRRTRTKYRCAAKGSGKSRSHPQPKLLRLP